MACAGAAAAMWASSASLAAWFAQLPAAAAATAPAGAVESAACAAAATASAAVALAVEGVAEALAGGAAEAAAAGLAVGAGGGAAGAALLWPEVAFAPAGSALAAAAAATGGGASGAGAAPLLLLQSPAAGVLVASTLERALAWGQLLAVWAALFPWLQRRVRVRAGAPPPPLRSLLTCRARLRDARWWPDAQQGTPGITLDGICVACGGSVLRPVGAPRAGGVWIARAHAPACLPACVASRTHAARVPCLRRARCAGDGRWQALVVVNVVFALPFPQP